MDFTVYLKETPLLDFSSPAIERMPQWQDWNQKKGSKKAEAIYDFVRNEIDFGYNSADDLPASAVLSDGYGQCNTKGTLLMALLRKAGIPCRLHGFTIDKALQAGAIPPLVQKIAPDEIIHSWVEAFVDGRWLKLEGFILDDPYLTAIQKKFAHINGAFCGYGIATDNLQNPKVAWTGEDTFIQVEGIAKDFGLFDSPDAFYREKGVNLSGFKSMAYKSFVRRWMNQNVNRLRKGG